MRANIPKGMGGGPQNMQAMIRQAQKMQEDMAAKQEELDAREYEIKAGGGAVVVKISGKKEVLSIDISPEIVDPDDIETLSDILVMPPYASYSARISAYEDFKKALAVLVPSVESVRANLSPRRYSFP